MQEGSASRAQTRAHAPATSAGRPLSYQDRQAQQCKLLRRDASLPSWSRSVIDRILVCLSYFFQPGGGLCNYQMMASCPGHQLQVEADVKSWHKARGYKRLRFSVHPAVQQSKGRPSSIPGNCRLLVTAKL